MTNWTTLTLRIVTPLFSGDDAVTSGDTVRVPSIRGALRFWFRAVSAGHGVTDPAVLWQQEEEVFGSTNTPSPIALRIRERHLQSTFQHFPQWAVPPPNASMPGVQYLLGPGLWSPKEGVLRPFIPPGRSFELDIRFSRIEKIDARFMYALWAWLTFGGLGARTRRGLGQLRLQDVGGADLPGLWDTNYLAAPSDPAGWEQLAGNPAVPDMEDLADHEWGTLISGSPTDGGDLPEWPVLAPRWWRGRLLSDKEDRWDRALHRAGMEWRGFQLCARPERGLSTPEWDGAIQGTDKRYPRAALGLPVTYYRRPDSDTRQTEFKTTVEAQDEHDGSLRRASPVWIRPVLIGEREWRVFTHVFWARLLPNGARLTMSEDGAGRPLNVPSADELHQVWTNWAKGSRRIPKGYYQPDR